MLSSECPWCSNKVSTYQLGSRARKIKPKWFQFTRHVQVCPYCNNPIKIDQKSIRWILLVLPLFFIMLARIFLGSDSLPRSPYSEVGYGLAAIGLLVSLFTLKFSKDQDL